MRSPSTLDSTESKVNSIPAGGENPKQFNWKEVWYPVHYIKDLDKTKPTRFTLLEKDVVIWWDKNSQSWQCFEDKCPHRLAPLSEGRINQEGLLECPYHGWTFSGSGKCEEIPQQTPGKTAQESKRACVKACPTIEAQGLLFVYPGESENAANVTVPIVKPLEETPDEWIVLDTFRDLPYDALTLLENVLDASHVSFTHHGSVGNRSNASTVDLEVVESGRQGFQGVWEEGPRKGTLGRQETTFIAPHLMWHDLTSKQFGRTLTVVYATPISKGRCRLFARFPFKFSSPIPKLFMKLSPPWYTHLGQNNVLEDDQIFLHYQERYLDQLGGSEKFAKAFYLPTKADRFVVELRNWVNQYEAEPFPDETLSPALSTEQLLDRYSSHTIHCSSCRSALKNIQQLRLFLGILAVTGWAIAPLISLTLNNIWIVAFLTVISLSCGAVWLGLGKLEKRFYQGQETPARNLPEKGKNSRSN
ncbi:MAG: Rieske 2Fe-2S domain-containing protein [Halothece sp.]